MAAAKRKTCHVEAESAADVDKKRAAASAIFKDDMLSDLPEALQLRILAYLDPKQAVQTALLSKTWVNLWTRIPVLTFNYLSFKDMSVFDRFVDRVLRRHDPLTKLEGLRFNGHESCNPKTLKNVFDYVYLHGVKELEVSIERVYDHDASWPGSLCESLTSLKLQTDGSGRIRCPFLGPGSKSLKNLAVLYLKRAFIIITDVEPFSGFPLLESLTLLNCEFWTENKAVIRVRVQSLRLSDLTISYCEGVKCWELRTPRLRFLEYGGFDEEFPKHEGLPVLETLKIDFRGFSFSYYKGKEEEKRMNDYLMFLFSTNIPNVKLVHNSPDANLPLFVLHTLFLALIDLCNSICFCFCVFSLFCN